MTIRQTWMTTQTIVTTRLCFPSSRPWCPQHLHFFWHLRGWGTSKWWVRGLGRREGEEVADYERFWSMKCSEMGEREWVREEGDCVWTKYIQSDVGQKIQSQWWWVWSSVKQKFRVLLCCRPSEPLRLCFIPPNYAKKQTDDPLLYILWLAVL